MADVTEIDCATGEVTHRDFTPEEIAQREKDAADYAAAEAARVAEVEAREAARASAVAKLKKLGLDDAEIAAIVSV